MTLSPIVILNTSKNHTFLVVCSSLFPYSTVAGARALVDSQDALSVFEATVVEDRAYSWLEHRLESHDLRTDTLNMHISLGTPSLVSSTFIMEGKPKTSIGWFHVGVATYSWWSERHLPQIELLAGNPSENLCPVRGGQL